MMAMDKMTVMFEVPEGVTAAGIEAALRALGATRIRIIDPQPTERPMHGGYPE